jgi:hypothetical protein
MKSKQLFRQFDRELLKKSKLSDNVDLKEEDNRNNRDPIIEEPARASYTKKLLFIQPFHPTQNEMYLNVNILRDQKNVKIFALISDVI